MFFQPALDTVHRKPEQPEQPSMLSTLLGVGAEFAGQQYGLGRLEDMLKGGGIVERGEGKSGGVYNAFLEELKAKPIFQ